MAHHMSRRIHIGTTAATNTMADTVTRVLAARADPTCTNDSDPGCTKPTQVPTLAIALAIVYVPSFPQLSLANP
jgi:hypothetical protein